MFTKGMANSYSISQHESGQKELCFQFLD